MLGLEFSEPPVDSPEVPEPGQISRPTAWSTVDDRLRASTSERSSSSCPVSSVSVTFSFGINVW